MSKRKLNEKQKAFAAEYRRDRNATQAAIRAGYSPKTAYAIAHKLLKKDDIKALIKAGTDAVFKKADITEERILEAFAGIAFTDPNELTELRRGCCRHCFGKDHLTQHTAAEQRARIAMHRLMQRDMATFDEEGGTGYDASRLPNPACPECHGEGGAPIVIMKDTRFLSPRARHLFAGVKQTAHGLEMKTNDKGAALVQLGRYKGMFKDQVTHDVTDALGELMVAIDGRSRGLPKSA